MLSLPSIGTSEAHGVAEPRLEGPRALSHHMKDSSPLYQEAPPKPSHQQGQVPRLGLLLKQ